MPLVPISFLSRCISDQIQVVLYASVMACVAVFSAWSFLFMLALQGDQPYLSVAPNGRCDALFDTMEKVSSADSGVSVGYRYDAGHSAVMVCTNKSLDWYSGHLAGHAVSFDPWKYQAESFVQQCNDTDFSTDGRVNATTPISGKKAGSIVYANPANPDPLTILPSPNGSWWVYTLIFNTSFVAPGCGADGQGLTLEYNQLPTCTGANVWAFEHNDGTLILYYQVILILIFVPHFYYLYACIRFWWHIDKNPARSARYYEEAQKGLPAIWFAIRAWVRVFRCSTGGLVTFVDTYVIPDQLPPVGRKIFLLDSFAYLSEVSFGAIALFGCRPAELQKPALLLLSINLAKSAILFLNGAHSWWTRRHPKAKTVKTLDDSDSTTSPFLRSGAEVETGAEMEQV
jgi:hypothetical protein